MIHIGQEYISDNASFTIINAISNSNPIPFAYAVMAGALDTFAKCFCLLHYWLGQYKFQLI